MSDKEPEKQSTKEEFNNVGWRLYSTMSSIPVSIIIGMACYGAYTKDPSNLMLAGAVFGALGFVGSVFETVRLMREAAKMSGPSDVTKGPDNNDKWDDDEDDWHVPPPSSGPKP